MAVTRLSGGLTPANGSDPRTFPAIWNATATDIEAAETDIAAIEANNWVTTARINNLAVTEAKLAASAVTEGKIAADAVTTAKILDANVTSAKLGPGTILQVVSAVKTDVFSVSLASGATSGDVTGLTASITPRSTSSNILVLLSVSVGSPNKPSGVILYRGGSVLTGATGDLVGSRVRLTSQTNTGNDAASTVPVSYLDSPASVSAQSYTVRLHSGAGATETFYVNRSAGDPNSSLGGRTVSSITLIEVAA